MDYEAVRQGLDRQSPSTVTSGSTWPRSARGVAWFACPTTSGCTTTSDRSTPAHCSPPERRLRRRVRGRIRGADGRDHPLARTAEISYLKLARGPITATGTLGEGKSDLLGRLDSDGKVEFPVEVEMTDAEGNTVAAMTVHWHVRKNA